MPLLAHIDADLATAMKAGEAARTTTLRLIKSSLKNEQIKLGHELTEPEAIKVLQREAKQRKDSITQYQQGGRADLAASEQAELAIIATYLPQQLSPAELAALVDSVVAASGATELAQTGEVIGAVLQQAAGRTDGAAVSQLVRQKLS